MSQSSSGGAQIMAIFVVCPGQVLPSSVPTVVAESEQEQEALAQEFARTMHAWVHRLSNGMIFVSR